MQSRADGSVQVLNLLENDPRFGNIRELRTFVGKVCVDAIIAIGKAARSPEVTLTREIIENRLNKKVTDLTIRRLAGFPGRLAAVCRGRQVGRIPRKN